MVEDISQNFRGVQGNLAQDMSSVLAGQDDMAIAQSFGRIFLKKVREEYSQSNPVALALFEKTEGILRNNSKAHAQMRIRTALEAMSVEDRLAYSKMRTVGHSLHTASALLGALNMPDDAAHNVYNLEKTMQDFKGKGMSIEDMEEFLSMVAINMATTPHPTEHLTSRGIVRFKELLNLANVPEERREKMAERIIGDFLREEIIPRDKLTIGEENTAAEAQAEIHMEAIRVLYRRMKKMIDKVYGGEEEKPDLLKIAKHINWSMHTWSAAGDADGKVNAERVALIGGVAGMKKKGVVDAIKGLADASSHLEKEQELWDRVDNIRRLLGDDGLQGKLKALQNKCLEQSGDYSYGSFHELERDYEKLFKGLSLRNGEGRSHINPMTAQEEKDGTGIVRQIEEELVDIIENVRDKDAKKALEETLFMVRAQGLMAARVDFRHNGLVYQDIMNNLFQDTHFLDRVGLEDTDIGEMTRKGGYTKLSDQKQREILRKVRKQISAQEMQDFLFKANPLPKDNDSYPPQTHEFLMRFKLMAEYPDMFGRAIIAEADSMSADYQDMFAAAFEIKGMQHMPLNEDQKNIKDAPDNMAAWYEEQKWYKFNDLDTGSIYMQMLPQSDVIKALGPLGRILTAKMARKTAYIAAKTGNPTMLMWGNGLANERGGGNSIIAWRYMAQGVQDFLDERVTNGGKKYLDKSDPKDLEIMRMVVYQSSTEQGRAVRMLNATPQQIARKYANTMAEMMGRCLELQGLQEPGAWIPPRDNFSPKLEAFIDKTYIEIMESYSDFRTAVPEGKNRPVTDSWADQASDPTVATAQNLSARADSKKAGNPNLTEQRAIGNNNWLALARTHHDGWFSVGAFLERVHDAYISGELDQQDIQDFMESEFMDFNVFSTSLNPAARADMVHGFMKLGVEDQWSHDRAIDVAAHVQLRTETIGEEQKLVFIKRGAAADVSDEEDYQAALYAEHFKFLALTESLAKGEFDKSMHDILNAFRPKNAANEINKVIPGQKTRADWENLDKVLDDQIGAIPELEMADLFEKENQERIASGEEPYDPTIMRMVGAAAKSQRPPHHQAFVNDHVYGTRNSAHLVKEISSHHGDYTPCA